VNKRALTWVVHRPGNSVRQQHILCHELTSLLKLSSTVFIYPVLSKGGKTFPGAVKCYECILVGQNEFRHESNLSMAHDWTK
jgi:hypothetical protein